MKRCARPCTGSSMSKVWAPTFGPYSCLIRFCVVAYDIQIFVSSDSILYVYIHRSKNMVINIKSEEATKCVYIYIYIYIYIYTYRHIHMYMYLRKL